jgi:hypothetical protein
VRNDSVIPRTSINIPPPPKPESAPSAQKKGQEVRPSTGRPG